MKKLTQFLFLFLIIFIGACTEGDDISPSAESSGDRASGESSGNGSQGQAGLITAGEWNDLIHWDFWNELLDGQSFSSMPKHWSIFIKHRVSVHVANSAGHAANVKVELLRNENSIWEAKTDNLGDAELWVSPFQDEDEVDHTKLSLKINDILHDDQVVMIDSGVNQINIGATTKGLNRVELAFIVDATGSMSDELEFLKEDLKSVIDSVQRDNSTLSIHTASVFYRDEGDDYITRKSEFSTDLNTTVNFINNQSAGGGGDFPEAVHTALDIGINDLQWSQEAKTRIAFLVLDAPPHHRQDVIVNLHSTIREAAKKGIKVIPITASGIDKETEFLMRFMSITTNGTYVFITGHSGIGNEHLEASVGEYQVEYLNELMVRLIKKYTE
ncbi:MAG: vWA domain-containing protein [Bacteroidia bacterium]